jgi:hypothetical protein
MIYITPMLITMIYESIKEIRVRGHLPNRLFGETTGPGGSLDEGVEERNDEGEMQEDVE